MTGAERSSRCEADVDALSSKTILLDCRWLGLGGPGRATDLLLRGLNVIRPPGRWIIWGGAAADDLQWNGAIRVPSTHPPTALAGQRELAGVPRHDLAIYMHQIRPLRAGCAVTFMHDTIPFRYGGSRFQRAAKRLFFRLAAGLSTRILTPSEYSKRALLRDLSLEPEKIVTVAYPIDDLLVGRVRRLRGMLPARHLALYVGSFMRHKNLERLLDAFGSTRFAAAGGELLLVGGTARRVLELRAYAQQRGLDRVSVEEECPQEQLDELYATARLLVLPSLEEGFGFPAWEAICCGLPTCVSDAGPLREITRGLAETFPPTDVKAIAAAIDRTAERTPGTTLAASLSAPSVEEYAAHVLAAAALVADS